MEHKDILLGDKVFCIDPKAKKVYEATITGMIISPATGYVIIDHVTAKYETKQLECKHIHATKEAAETRLLEINPKLDKADRIVKTTTADINAIRVEVIGAPEFEELSKEMRENGK